MLRMLEQYIDNKDTGKTYSPLELRGTGVDLLKEYPDSLVERRYEPSRLERCVFGKGPGGGPRGSSGDGILLMTLEVYHHKLLRQMIYAGANDRKSLSEAIGIMDGQMANPVSSYHVRSGDGLYHVVEKPHSQKPLTSLD